MVLFDAFTDVVSDFGQKLVMSGCAGEFMIRDATLRKFMFNSLIGALHPNQNETPHTVIVANEVDLGQILASTDKKFTKVQKTTDGKHIVSFVYKDSHMRGHNYPYIPAQIIARTRILIRRAIDALIEQDANIVGTMTDSIIFSTKKPVDWTRPSLASAMTIGTNPGQFSLKRGNEIVAIGPGQYGLFRHVGGKSETIQLRLTGHTRENHSPDLLRAIYAECSKLPIAHPLRNTLLPVMRNRHEHLLLIGEAGVGKSRYIVNTFRNHGTVRLGSTGMAAASIGGSTVHSWFGIGIDMPIGKILSNMTAKRLTKLAHADTIIIDECYGIGCTAMARVDEVMRAVRGTTEPFGGVKFIFVGDDRQLLAVKDTPFMASEHGLTIMRREIPYDAANARLLPEWRQQLAYLRTDRSADDLIGWIKSLTRANAPFPHAKTVYYTRADVDSHNERMIADVDGPEYELNGYRFKAGTPIMLKRNGTTSKGRIRDGIYNGALGTFVSYHDDALTIMLDGKERTLKGYTDIVPAYAITIHKMQGQTVDKINVRMRTGQLHAADATRLLYVALSRVRSAEDVYLEPIG